MPKQSLVVVGLGKIRAAYRHPSAEIDQFCEGLQAAATRPGSKWFPGRNPVQAAACECLSEVAGHLQDLRTNDLAMESEPDKITEQLNLCLVCFGSSCRNPGDLTRLHYQSKVEPGLRELLADAANIQGKDVTKLASALHSK